MSEQEPHKPISLVARVVIWTGLVASAIYAAGAVAGTGGRAGDYYWSLAAGRWMSAHHQVLTHDPFSYVLSGRRIVSTEWAYDWLLATVQRVGGNGGVGAMLLVLGAAGVAAGVWYVRRLGATWGRAGVFAVIITLLSAGLISQGRALTLSLIYFPLLLGLLHLTRSHPKWLWALIPLFLVWANTHGSVLLGLATIGMEVAWSRVKPDTHPALEGRSRHPGALLWGFGGALVASMVTPWGPGLLFYDLKLATNGQITHIIQEWQSPDFHNVLWLLVLGGVLLGLGRAIKNAKAGALEVTLAIFLLVGWLHAVRTLPYLVVVIAGLMCVDHTPVVSRAWGRGLAVFASAWAVAAVAGVLVAGTLSSAATQQSAPSKAFSYLSAHHVNSRVLAFYDWGGYEMLQGRMTFVDGRTDLFVGTVLHDYSRLANGTIDPISVLNRYEVSYVVWKNGLPLYFELSSNPGWARVYDKGGISIFTRTGVNPYANVNGMLQRS
jgi:hypothetical protein